jgi:hypothetical protein
VTFDEELLVTKMAENKVRRVENQRCTAKSTVNQFIHAVIMALNVSEDQRRDAAAKMAVDPPEISMSVRGSSRRVLSVGGAFQPAIGQSFWGN